MGVTPNHPLNTGFFFHKKKHPAITNQAKLGLSARKTKSLSLNGVIRTLTYTLIVTNII